MACPVLTVRASLRATPEADVNIEFQSASRFSDEAMKFAFYFRETNEKYATHYPAAVGNHMTNTDSTPFEDSLQQSVSARTNAACTPALDGIPIGISPQMYLRHSATRTFAWD